MTNEEPVKITDVCPVCKKINKKTWVIAQIKDKSMKICKQCSDDLPPPGLDGSYQDETRKRREAERQAKNREIIRQLKTNSYPRTPGSHK